MDKKKPPATRYVASPYSYYPESGRPRSWSVWDREEGRWARGQSVGGRESAEKWAKDLEETGRTPGEDHQHREIFELLADSTAVIVQGGDGEKYSFARLGKLWSGPSIVDNEAMPGYLYRYVQQGYGLRFKKLTLSNEGRFIINETQYPGEKGSE